jgi:DNA-directed RNA polymerase beta' subunit
MLSLESSDILIEWTTAEEINSATYEVQKSVDAKNWNTIAYVMAAVNSSSTSNYSYKDKELTSSLIYYRIKEVDQNGSITYTSIRSIRTETSASLNNIKIENSEHTVFIQFQQQVKGNVMIRFISLSGQILTQQVVNQPVGQLTLNANSNLKGNYIVSVSNGQDVAIAKQIIL